jgi:molecular chaperone GrpE
MPANEDQPPKEYNIDDFDAEAMAAGEEGGDRVAELTHLLAEANSRALRAVADHQNYVRRAIQNEQVAKQQGVASVVQNVVGVMDHFDLALNLDPQKATTQQVIEGVRVIREELIRSLQKVGVTVIAPAPNEEFRPGIHEAIMQQSVDGVEPGRIAATFQPGYVLGERLIRAAKVSVSPG